MNDIGGDFGEFDGTGVNRLDQQLSIFSILKEDPKIDQTDSWSEFQ